MFSSYIYGNCIALGGKAVAIIFKFLLEKNKQRFSLHVFDFGFVGAGICVVFIFSPKFMIDKAQIIRLMLCQNLYVPFSTSIAKSLALIKFTLTIYSTSFHL